MAPLTKYMIPDNEWKQCTSHKTLKLFIVVHMHCIQRSLKRMISTAILPHWSSHFELCNNW